MKLALLKGNRFNPWHMQAYAKLDDWDVTCFRADSEIQQRFDERGGAGPDFAIEPIHFRGGDATLSRKIQHRLGMLDSPFTDAVIEPFHDRLQGYDLIQSWELFTPWTAEALEAKKKYGVPLAIMVWDNIPFNQEKTEAQRETKKRAIAEADRFLVHTERSRRMLQIEGVDDARITMAPIGVDVKRFAPREGDRAALGLSADKFVVLFVGWLLPRKGIDFLIWAMADLTKRIDSPLHLHIIGTVGEDRVKPLLDRVGDAFTHTFAGSVPYADMPAHYNAADAFVLPSIATDEWQEQFGMSLIEAMASGLPIVATRSGAIPEVAGDAATLVQPNDFTAISDALHEFIHAPNDASALAQRARSRAQENFDLNKCANEMEKIYATLRKK